jgi:hypothetical protein
MSVDIRLSRRDLVISSSAGKSIAPIPLGTIDLDGEGGKYSV